MAASSTSLNGRPAIRSLMSAHDSPTGENTYARSTLLKIHLTCELIDGGGRGGAGGAGTEGG